MILTKLKGFEIGALPTTQPKENSVFQEDSSQLQESVGSSNLLVKSRTDDVGTAELDTEVEGEKKGKIMEDIKAILKGEMEELWRPHTVPSKESEERHDLTFSNCDNTKEMEGYSFITVNPKEAHDGSSYQEGNEVDFPPSVIIKRGNSRYGFGFGKNCITFLCTDYPRKVRTHANLVLFEPNSKFVVSKKEIEVSEEKATGKMKVFLRVEGEPSSPNDDSKDSSV